MNKMGLWHLMKLLIKDWMWSRDCKRDLVKCWPFWRLRRLFSLVFTHFVVYWLVLFSSLFKEWECLYWTSCFIYSLDLTRRWSKYLKKKSNPTLWPLFQSTFKTILWVRALRKWLICKPRNNHLLARKKEIPAGGWTWSAEFSSLSSATSSPTTSLQEL